MTSIDTTRARLLEILDSLERNAHAEDIEVILAEFVVIPRNELPEVVAHEDGDLFVGQRWYDATASASDRRDLALANLAVAEWVEAQETTKAETKRNARRDELAVNLAEGLKSYGEHRVYAGLSTVAKRAIDRIIELEEAAA